jgi:hypothetical protein
MCCDVRAQMTGEIPVGEFIEISFDRRHAIASLRFALPNTFYKGD